MASVLPLSFLQRTSHQKVMLPFYHLINDKVPAHIKQLYTTRGTQLFEQDLDYLLHYFRPIPLEELIAINKKIVDPPIKPVMHLSFDDGLSECYDVIAPILEKKGVSATFFLNTAFLDNQALMFRYKASLCLSAMEEMNAEVQANLVKKAFSLQNIEKDINRSVLSIKYKDSHLLNNLAEIIGLNFENYLEDKKPYLSSTQVDHLIERGFAIGSHSVDHPLYRSLSVEEQLEQTICAQKYLEERFSLDYRVFAFPFTDDGVSKKFFEALETQMPFDLTFGGAGLKQDVIANNIQRFPMETDKLDSARKMINTEYLYYLLKAPFSKNRLNRAD